MFEDFEEELIEDADDAVSAAPDAPGLAPPREAAAVLGHEEIESQLFSAFTENRLPHALVLAGPEGIGKSTLAFRIARFLLKALPPAGGGLGGGEAPGSDMLFGLGLPPTQPSPRRGEGFDIDARDPIFSQVASGGHADLLVIERLMDDKKGKMQEVIAVDEVRKITPFLRMTASNGGWRVVIVDDADTMNRNSQNAILKILEEPPPRTLLILIAHNVGSLLPTIRSRSRVVAMKAPDRALFAELLRRAGAVSEGEVAALYAFTSGSVGQALRLQREGALESLATLLTLLEAHPRWDWPQIHALADRLGRAGQDDAYHSFSQVFLWTLDAMVRAKARAEPLPPPLDGSAAARLIRDFSLPALLQTGDRLKELFATTDFANLDKRQAVLGAFTVLGNMAES